MDFLLAMPLSNLQWGSSDAMLKAMLVSEGNIGVLFCQIMFTTWYSWNIFMWLNLFCDSDLAASEDGRLFLLSDNGEKLTQ